jgi:hypothetical protein
MPHVTPEQRELLDRGGMAVSIGELTYQITAVCNEWLRPINPEERGFERGFSDYATIITALECAKLEFYRLIVAPYEDKAVERNGSAYDSLT